MYMYMYRVMKALSFAYERCASLHHAPRCTSHFSAVRASNSATVSSYEGFRLCIGKMRLVALIILVPGRASNLAGRRWGGWGRGEGGPRERKPNRIRTWKTESETENTIRRASQTQSDGPKHNQKCNQTQNTIRTQSGHNQGRDWLHRFGYRCKT